MIEKGAFKVIDHEDRILQKTFTSIKTYHLAYLWLFLFVVHIVQAN